MRQLRRDSPRGRRSGTFAGTAAAGIVVVVAAVIVAQSCSIPASQALCPAAVALSLQGTLQSPGSLGRWTAFRAIVLDSLRRQGQGLRGKNSCQFSLYEVRTVDLHHGELRVIRTG